MVCFTTVAIIPQLGKMLYTLDLHNIEVTMVTEKYYKNIVMVLVSLLMKQITIAIIMTLWFR